jgi:hypothetical protein
MTREEVIGKAKDLITPFFGAAQTEKLIDTIINLEKVSDVRMMRPLLQRG